MRTVIDKLIGDILEVAKRNTTCFPNILCE